MREQFGVYLALKEDHSAPSCFLGNQSFPERLIAKGVHNFREGALRREYDSFLLDMYMAIGLELLENVQIFSWVWALEPTLR